jgi:hypothetical protein
MTFFVVQSIAIDQPVEPRSSGGLTKPCCLVFRPV